MNSLSRSILVLALYAYSWPHIAAAQRDLAVKSPGAEQRVVVVAAPPPA